MFFVLHFDVIEYLMNKNEIKILVWKSGNYKCGVCLNTEHPTYMCPLLQEDVRPIKFVGGYQQPKKIN